MSIRTVAAAAAALAFALPALANDSSAELAAGGLVLTRNADIEMRSEDLFVSPAEVRVTYRFFNTAARDAQVLVAFPMPDIFIDGPGDNVSIPTEDPQNILAFSTMVDGRPVAAQAEQKAVDRRGVDRTELLKGLGIPLAPHLQSTGQALDRLPQGGQQLLLGFGLVQPEEYDAGRGMERHLTPRWRLKTTYYWRQTFPARREITVQHRYKPSVGMSAGTMVGWKDFRTSKEFAALKTRYCMDEAYLTAAERLRPAGQDFAPLFEKRISYILSSGANWKKPIGSFRLVVDKGRPDALVSFCATGVTKISPTQFEMRKSNFLPTKDLNILILEPYDPEG